MNQWQKPHQKNKYRGDLIKSLAIGSSHQKQEPTPRPISMQMQDDNGAAEKAKVVIPRGIRAGWRV
jgi:hypothetical protein